MNEHIQRNGTNTAQNMDERTWRNSEDPHELLAALHPMPTLGSVQPQTRQSRMYLLACARRKEAWRRLPAVCRALVSLAERCAEEPCLKDKLRSALAPIAEKLMNAYGEENDLLEAEAELTTLGASGGTVPAAVLARQRDRMRKECSAEPAPPLRDDEWKGLARLVYFPFDSKTPLYQWIPPEFHSVRLIREVYGRPFAFAPFHADWRTTLVVNLARDMYWRREFSAMPILADALQDAGCTDREILTHCQNRQQHVRGCWVLDQILSN